MISRRLFAKIGFGAISAASSSNLSLNSQAGKASGSSSPLSFSPVGKRRLSKHWGYQSERIDVRSGNLLFTLPLLQLKSRKLKAAARLSFNSLHQHSLLKKLDKESAPWTYGSGWSLRVAAVVPHFTNGEQGYIYVDSYGSEYLLIRLENRWTSPECDFISWYPDKHLLCFSDGTRLLFSCEAASGEHDAGVLSPTLIECRNGNQITLEYEKGNGAANPDSSSRLSRIEDSYSFMNTAESTSYRFTYEGEAGHRRLASIVCFGDAQKTLFFHYSDNSTSEVPLLVGVDGVADRSWQFEYLTDGCLRSVILSRGGRISWEYETSSGADFNHQVVARRTLEDFSSGMRPTSVIFERKTLAPNGACVVSLKSEDGAAAQTWRFTSKSEGSRESLLTDVSIMDGGRELRRISYEWNAIPSGRPYVSRKTTILDPGSSDEQASSESFVRDEFGNCVQHSVSDYRSSGASDLTSRFEYHRGADYVNNHILNLKTSHSVTDRTETITVAERRFDETSVSDSGGLRTHNPAFGPAHQARGNCTTVIKRGVSTHVTYDKTGLAESVTQGGIKKIGILRSAATNNVLVEGVELGAAQPSFTITHSPGQTMSVERGGTLWSERTFDASGRLTQLKNRLGVARSIEYSPDLRSVTTHSGSRWSRRVKDGFGRTIKVEKGVDGTTLSVRRIEYNASGIQPLTGKSRFTYSMAPDQSAIWHGRIYDALGRVSARLTDGVKTTTILYRGNVRTAILKSGRWKSLVYDAKGRVIKAILPGSTSVNEETLYTYDVLGKLVNVTVPRGASVQTREFRHDSGGRLKGQRLPESGLRKYSYDNYGALVSIKDAKGQEQHFERDALRRLVRAKRYRQNGSLSENDTVAYEYFPTDDGNVHAAGRFKAVSWGSVSTTPGLMTYERTLDALGRLALQTLRVERQKSSLELTITLEYDGEGRLAKVTYPLDGPILTYTYDALGRTIGLSDSHGPVVSDVRYTSRGKLSNLTVYSIDRTSSVTQALTYEDNIRPTSLIAYRNGNAESLDTHLQWRYSDGENKIRSEDDVLNQSRLDYQYDGQGRIAAVSRSGAPVGTWSYDEFGNRASQEIFDHPALSRNARYDPATNWLIADHPLHDANGNLLEIPLGRLEYDTLNRISKFIAPGGWQHAYFYDPSNHRIWDISGREQILTVYFDGKPLAEYRITENDAQLGATLNHYNVHFGNRLVRAGDEIFVIDRIGSTRATVSSGVPRIHQYFPYGEEYLKTEGQGKRFQGYQRDAGSEIDYADQRYYVSAFGRFTTADPKDKSAHASDPMSWNRYTFVHNDPVNNTDPTGLDDYDSYDGYDGYADYDGTDDFGDDGGGGGGGGDDGSVDGLADDGVADDGVSSSYNDPNGDTGDSGVTFENGNTVSVSTALDPDTPGVVEVVTVELLYNTNDSDTEEAEIPESTWDQIQEACQEAVEEIENLMPPPQAIEEVKQDLEWYGLDDYSELLGDTDDDITVVEAILLMIAAL